MDIRPIATEKDYEAALAEIKRLWAAEAGSPEAQKIEMLAMLAQAYERAREPPPKADPIEAIKFRMDQQGLRRKDLLPIFGTTARISETLNGKRSLTLSDASTQAPTQAPAPSSLRSPRVRGRVSTAAPLLGLRSARKETATP